MIHWRRRSFTTEESKPIPKMYAWFTTPVSMPILKLVTIKKENQLSFVYRYQRKDITKNYPLKEGYQEVERLISNDFLNFNLFTTESDWSGEIGHNDHFKLKQKSPSFTNKPIRQHDKEKTRLVGKTEYLYHFAKLELFLHDF